MPAAVHIGIGIRCSTPSSVMQCSSFTGERFRARKVECLAPCRLGAGVDCATDPKVTIQAIKLTRVYAHKPTTLGFC